VRNAKTAEGEKADRATAKPESLAPTEIRRQPSVRKALAEAAPRDAPARKRGFPAMGWLFAVIAAALGLAYLLSVRDIGLPWIRENEIVRRVTLAASVTAALLAIRAFAIAILTARVKRRVVRYNVLRVVKLAIALLIVLSAVSLLFVGWYGTVVSLGLLSLILGFALQAPLTSFFAWIFILVRSPYRVGDRVRVGQATGDVIDVGYIDTTLWEFGGDFLSTDHPSGRIIRFPNAMVFNSMVYNYSWPLFPYIWNEITVQLGYQADLEFVASAMKAAVQEEMGNQMSRRVKVYRDLLADTPVDHLEVDEEPSVLFRVNDNTWIDATVRYLVTPRNAGRRKTLLTRKILERLNAEPNKVLFPKGANR
jgi:small-conductance mechanosensitive channel